MIYKLSKKYKNPKLYRNNINSMTGNSDFIFEFNFEIQILKNWYSIKARI